MLCYLNREIAVVCVQPAVKARSLQFYRKQIQKPSPTDALAGNLRCRRPPPPSPRGLRSTTHLGGVVLKCMHFLHVARIFRKAFLELN